jgi:hypothetical protein
MGDLEIQREAQRVIERYGEDAFVWSASKAVRLENNGDKEASHIWKRITKAVRALDREKSAAIT